MSSIEPNKVSNFDKAINYVSKGAEIGKTLMAEKKDVRMKSLLEAPNTGENLSIGAKAINLVYLGLVALPALGSYKATDTIMKHIQKKDYDKAMASKTDLQKDFNSLFKTKIGLGVQMREITNKHSEEEITKQYKEDEILSIPEDLLKARVQYRDLNLKSEEFEKKLTNKLEKLEKVNVKLGVSVVNRSKENLMMRMQALEEASNTGYVAVNGTINLLDDTRKNELLGAREKIKNEFISANEEAINDYTRVLDLRDTTNNRYTVVSDSDEGEENISGEGENNISGKRNDELTDAELLRLTENLTDDQIRDLLREHEEAVKFAKEIK